jgi:hypothetical protein
MHRLSLRPPTSLVLALALIPLALVGCNDTSISTNNAAPEALIQSPPDLWVQAVEDTLELRGRVTDIGTANVDLEIIWASSLDGVLFEGAPDDVDGNSRIVMTPVNPGIHVISLTVSDEFGATGIDTIEATFTADEPPGCSITSPTEGSSIDPGEDVLIQAQVSDDNTPAEELGIQWFSTADGALSVAPADEFGVASANVTLSAQPHTLSIIVTDGAGQTCEDEVSIISNGPPTTPVVEISPDPLSIFEDMRADIVQDSIDPEGGEVSYALRWFLDDVHQTDLVGATVPADRLIRGQVWSIEMTAQDDQGTMALEPGTDLAVVPDTAPSALVLAVEPAEPTQAQDLQCLVTTPATDPDPSDVVTYVFEWLLDGQPTTLTGDTLSFLETAPDEDWTCVAWATDGTLDGPPTQATVSIVEGCSSLSTDGNFGHGVVPDDPALRLDTGDFTIEAWIRPDGFQNNTDDAALLSKRTAGSQQGWHLGITDDGVPYFHVSIGANPRLDANETLPLGVWAHIAVTYDAGAGLATFWIDGGAAGSASLPSPNGLALGNLLFGEDGAGLSDRVFEGLIDDVRLSSTARYSLAFLPPTVIAADADTLALWAFEEASGTTMNDSSGAGHTGAVVGADWSTDSTCELDLAPTQPVVSLDLDYPDDDDVVTCSLDLASVDPEGQPVTYDGQWWVDGVPSGHAFTTFPGILPDTLTSEGESWTCHVVANDGGRDSDPGVASAWVGSMPVCSLEVTDTAAMASDLCSFEAPIDGLLRMTVTNPDGSADGSFSVDMGSFGTTWIFTGFKDAAYDGVVVLPWTERDIEMNLSPAMGTLAMTLGYDPEGSAGGTEDLLTLDFVFYDQLSTIGATELLNHEVPSAQSTDPAYPAATGDFVVGSGERLLLEAGPCGSTGVGAHGIYASNDGATGNDGLMRIETGSNEACANPLRSISISADDWTFSLNHEDDFWSDNTGDRGLTLYRY